MSEENKKENKKNKEDFEKEKKLDKFFKKEDEVQILLKEALEISKKNQKDIKYIKRFVIWSQIWGAIKILLIVIPIVLGFLYLPPLIDQWLGTYQDLLLGTDTNKNSSSNSILESIISK